MAHKKAKKKAPKKKTFLAVRSELVNVLDKAKEKFGTDNNVSKKMGFSENYIANLRHDINNGNATYDRMKSVKKGVLEAMKPETEIDLSKVLKKVLKKAAKKVAKKAAKKVIKKAAKKVKKAKRKVAKKTAEKIIGIRDEHPKSNLTIVLSKTVFD